MGGIRDIVENGVEVPVAITWAGELSTDTHIEIDIVQKPMPVALAEKVAYAILGVTGMIREAR
jgi:hypothetical protein